MEQKQGSSKLKLKFDSHLVSRIVDLGFLLAALFCFGMFAYNSVSSRYVQSGTAIANVTWGSPERKRVGMVSFTETKPGDPLYHRDAIWVGEGKTAQISFKNGAELRIEEKTFLVLHRQLGMNEHIEVLSGRVKLMNRDDKKAEELLEIDQAKNVDPQSSPTPNPSPSPQMEPVTRNSPEPEPASKPEGSIYPKPNTTFYLANQKQEFPITFAWPGRPGGEDGTLVVTDNKGAEVASVKVKQQNFAKTSLKVGHDYTWQFKAAKSAQVGPFRFKVVPFNANAFNQDLTGKNQQDPIEVVQ